ncbi:MAG: hypothetical protein H6791_02275 [Candidatus Nomurabacteria bacterium]|nr:MAG: hypothetical protein H6791_02275 [Candidatus Nomurabacteria bacterium]
MTKRILCVFGKKRQIALDMAAQKKGSATTFYGLSPFLLGEHNLFVGTLPVNQRNLFWAILKSDIVVFSKMINKMPFLRIVFFWKKFILINIDLNRSIKNKKSLLKRFWFFLKIMSFNKIVNFSTSQKVSLERYGVKKSKLEFIHFGIDNLFIEKRLSTHTTREDFYLVVGRDEGRDNQSVLHLAQKNPDKQFVFVVDSRVVEINSDASNIVILDNIPFEDLIVLYQKARAVIVHTYTDEENKGSDSSGQTVVMDALACGTPVFVSEKSWLQDYPLIKDNVLIYKKDNLESILLKNSLTKQKTTPYTTMSMYQEWLKIFSSFG